MKFAFTLLAVSVLLTACRHTEAAHQLLTDTEVNRTNFCGYAAGHRPTERENEELLVWARRAAEKRHIAGMPTDEEIRRHIVGAWVPDPKTDSDEYQTMVIRSDGSFTAIINAKVVREGTWMVDGGMMRLTTTNGAPTLNGFRYHSIDYVDDHKLVCGIDISVAGRMRFTK